MLTLRFYQISICVVLCYVYWKLSLLLKEKPIYMNMTPKIRKNATYVYDYLYVELLILLPYLFVFFVTDIASFKNWAIGIVFIIIMVLKYMIYFSDCDNSYCMECTSVKYQTIFFTKYYFVILVLISIGSKLFIQHNYIGFELFFKYLFIWVFLFCIIPAYLIIGIPGMIAIAIASVLLILDYQVLLKGGLFIIIYQSLLFVLIWIRRSLIIQLDYKITFVFSTIVSCFIVYYYEKQYLDEFWLLIPVVLFYLYTIVLHVVALVVLVCEQFINHIKYVASFDH